MNNNIPFALTDPQLALYGGLQNYEQNQIVRRITDINETTHITLQDIQNEWRDRYANQNIPNDLDNGLVIRAKNALCNEDIVDINRILNGELPVLRRDRGTLIRTLLYKVVELMQAQPVGGKLRKTSNKKGFIRRRSRSSKRKVRKARTTRRR